MAAASELLLAILSKSSRLYSMDANQLARFLVSARKNRGMTLRQVEAGSGISNAYLSQLERGKIKQPSPNVLHALAECYDISYALLMQRAGYPVPEGAAPAADRLEGLAARLGAVTPAEEDALADYLTFIRERGARHIT